MSNFVGLDVSQKVLSCVDGRGSASAKFDGR